MRIRLDLSYDGTDFSGWAKQPGFRTVQGELELALSKVLLGMWGKPVPTVTAGRTDTGVHASHQVVHFDYSQTSAVPKFPFFLRRGGSRMADGVVSAADRGIFDFPDLLYRLRCVLPFDMNVFAACQVPDDFSARFWATSRTYKYRICDSIQTYNPLRRADVHFVKNPLDVDLMNEAIRGFEGLHDFHTFVKPRKGATSTRDLQVFRFERQTAARDAGLVVATLQADAFAYNMVRSLVGAAVMVGDSRRPPEWIQECLQSKQRQGATGPIAAKGLTLEHIDYPDLDDPAALAAARERAQLIRNRREIRKMSYDV